MNILKWQNSLCFAKFQPLCCVTVVLLLLVYVVNSCVFITPHKSRFHGKDLRTLLLKYQGMRVELEPNHARYIQGQFINLKYRVTCEKSCVMPWSNLTISNYLEILKNGVPVEKMFIRGEGIDGSGRDTSMSHEDVVQVNGTYCDPNIRATEGLRYLTPGNYTGFLDDGIISPDFSFAIDPIPDSLQYLWDKYRAFNITENTRKRIDHAAIDSAAARVRYFMQFPVGALWRREALQMGIHVFQRYKHRHDSYKDMAEFNQEELQFLDSAFFALSEEPDVIPKSLVFDILNTLCPQDDKAERAASLVRFAERLGKPEIIQVAKDEAEEILRLEARRRNNR